MPDFFTPDFLDDCPPATAAVVEAQRRAALDVLAAQGYALIIPPLVEYIETLTAADDALDRKTFKMTDSVSGRTLGIRADQTPQIARYDALHSHTDAAPRRYCYCGPVLLTHPPQPWQSREMMQLGAELFDAPPPASDAEIISLAHQTLTALGLQELSLDVGHAGLFYAATKGVPASAQQQLGEAVARKDSSSLKAVINTLADSPSSLSDDNANALLKLANGDEDLTSLQTLFPAAVLDELQFIQNEAAALGCPVGINLSDLGSYGYHTGIVFSFYAGERVVARGGRYVPLAMHSKPAAHPAHPAVGFSLDLYRLPRAPQKSQ